MKPCQITIGNVQLILHSYWESNSRFMITGDISLQEWFWLEELLSPDNLNPIIFYYSERGPKKINCRCYYQEVRQFEDGFYYYQFKFIIENGFVLQEHWKKVGF